MTKTARYDKFKSRHKFHAKHAKPTRWARAMARFEAVCLRVEVALTPQVVFA